MSRTKATQTTVRPFLKWAGGKSQLLQRYHSLFPEELKNGTVDSYVEPFLGGGAVFFEVAQSYAIQRASLSDVNRDIVLAYRVVRSAVDELIGCLEPYARKYTSMPIDRRERFFYEVRTRFNGSMRDLNYQHQSTEWTSRAAQLIFLNRTCFNGLFRLNKQGEFNVPFGRYKSPRILDEDNLRGASELLQVAHIEAADFEDTDERVASHSFVYLDPPYRPISSTASFTSYSGNGFGDEEQIRLARWFRRLDALGSKLMLSNSDPKNIDAHDNFIDDLYSGYRIRRIPARRAINSDGRKRGRINEVVVTNY